jgi:arabinofuranan 3-O-arabinosyltransferase
LIVTSPPEARPAPARPGRRPAGGWLAHVIAVVLLVGLPFATSPGDIISDSKFELAVNPAGFLRAAFTLWNTQQFGQIQDQVVGYLFPMGPFFELLKLVNVDGWVIQRLWLAIVFVSAYAGTVLLARRLGIGGPWTRALGGLAYALSPMALGMAGELSAELLPAVLLPWILLPLTGSGGPRWRRAARSALGVALSGGVNGAATVAVLVPALIYLVMRRRRLLWWWLGAVVVGTAWWTIPLLLQSRYGVSILPYTESADTTTATTGLSDILRGTSDWTAYLNLNGQPWWPLAYQISTDFLPILGTGVLAALGLAGLMRRDMPERRFLAVSALAGVAIIAAGHVGAFGDPLAHPLDALINGPLSAFRNLWKFDPLIRLPVALGLAHLAATVRIRARLRVLTSAALASLVVLLVPAFTTGLAAQGAFAALPSAWTSAADWLNTHAGREDVLVVPGASFGQYLWGSPLDDALQPLTTADYAERDLSVIGSAGNERLLDAIDQRLAAGDGSAGLTQVLARMGVRYVVVRNDLVRQDLDGAWPARINDALDDSPGITRTATFGSYYGTYTPDDAATNFDSPYPEIEIYSVAGASPIATVQPVAGTIRVYGAPESELTLADEGLLGNHPVLINGDGAGIPATSVVTDSLRRQVRNFGELRTSYSPTLTASQPLSTFEATADYTEPGWDAYQAVASYSGVTSVTASSSASDITAITGQWASGSYPFEALAGTRGSWESGSWTGPLGQWLRVNLTHAVDVGSITAAFGDSDALGPAVTSVTVTTAAGSVSDPVSVTGDVQTLALPDGPTTWVRITVSGLAGSSGVGSQVAISSLAIPGLTASETIVAPDVSGSVVVLSKDEPQPSGCMLTSLRWVCSPDLETTTEEQYGFDHAFTAASAGRVTIAGSAILTDGALAGKLTRLRTSQAVVTASSTYTGDPQDQAASAFDGNPKTAWVASPDDQHPTLRISWSRAVSVSRLTISRPPGTSSAYLQALIIGSDGQARGVTVPANGVVNFKPMLTTGLTLEFTSTQAPLQITDVAIPGVPFHGTPSGTFRLACGLGPYLTVNGKVVPTSVTGTFTALETEQPVRFTACSAVTLRAGSNRVVEPTSDAFSIQSVVLTAARLPAATAPTAARIVSWNSSVRQVRVSTAAESYLVVNENYNSGWKATFDGSALHAVRLDGWKQAWILPAGTSGLVTLTYGPQDSYRDAIIGGLGGLAIIALLAAWPGWPPRRRYRVAPSPSSESVAPVRWVALGLTSIALGLWLGGYAGIVVVTAAAAVFLLPTRLRRAWIPAALLLTATISGALGEHLTLAGDAGGGVTTLSDTIPQLCCLIVVARLLISLVPER